MYLLHGFGSGPRTWLVGRGSYEGLNVATTLDLLIAKGEVGEMIGVMPDAGTGLGGSWYASSPVSGDWETLVARVLVARVDSLFRTRPERSGRGVAGQGMGGYGALRIALAAYPGALESAPIPARVLWSRAAAHRSALERTALRLEVGADDALAGEVERPSRRLGEAGVEHEMEPFEWGHVAGVRERFEGSVFQFFWRVLGAKDRDAGGRQW